MRAAESHAERVVGGFMAATAVAAIVAGVLVTPMIFASSATLSSALSFFALVTMVAAIIAAGHALLLGLPVYCLLRCIWPLHWWSAVLGGIALGVLPATLCIFLPDALGNSNGWGVLNLLLPVGWLSATGACAGLAFWWIARERRAPR